MALLEHGAYSLCRVLLTVIIIIKAVDADDPDPLKFTVEIGEFGSSALHSDIYVLKRLIDNVTSNYDVRIRPRVNQSHVVHVNLTFTPLSVVGLDTTSQRMDVLGVFGVAWHDELIYWNPDHYQGLNILKLPLKEVWRPKLVILKAVEGGSAVGNAVLDTVDVFSSPFEEHSTVAWVPESIYSVLCDLDVTYYPFDIQECQLTVYVSDENLQSVVLVEPDVVSLDQYSENAEWKLQSLKSSSYTRYNTKFISITFTLERRAQFTLYTVVLPLLLLSCLNVAGVMTPVDSGEKISYMVTLFLTFCFFVFTVRDGLPHNSLNVSYFLLYLLQMSILSVTSVIYTIVQARIFQAHGTEVVHWLRWFQRFKSPQGKSKTKQASTATSASKHVPSVKVIPLDRDKKKASDTGVGSESNKGSQKEITWAELFDKLDKILAVVLIVFVALFTCLFYGIVLNR